MGVKNREALSMSTWWWWLSGVTICLSGLLLVVLIAAVIFGAIVGPQPGVGLG